jgi:hypothetical protein
MPGAWVIRGRTGCLVVRGRECTSFRHWRAEPDQDGSGAFLLAVEAHEPTGIAWEAMPETVRCELELGGGEHPLRQIRASAQVLSREPLRCRLTEIDERVYAPLKR